MIFSIQHFLEDYFRRRGLTDVDQYAIRLANSFVTRNADVDANKLARHLSKLRTAFYRRNRGVDRRKLESELAIALLARFKKKDADSLNSSFGTALAQARTRLRGKPRTITALLSEFKRAVEARAVDMFWDARKRGELRARPEKIAQGLLAVFARGAVGQNGLILREVVSGIGFVDVGISFGAVLHLIELKILHSGKFAGAHQLADYMRKEGRRTGWLVILDSRAEGLKSAIPGSIRVKDAIVRTVVVDINPVPPHDMKA